MTADHWFDRLNKALVRRGPRRHFVRAAVAAVIPSLVFGAGHGAEAAKNQKERQQSVQPTAKPRKSCSKGACRRQWPRSKQDRRSCEATCKRCKRTRTKLCFLEGNPKNPAKVADCCPKGEPCCGDQCCPPWPTDEGPILSKCCFGKKCCPITWECCDDGKCCRPGGGCLTDIGRVCLSIEDTCCPDDGDTGWCGAHERCCPGVGCVAGDSCPEDDCPAGRPRCNGQCCHSLPSGRPTRCFGGTQCCPDDYVEPFWCPGENPDPAVVCIPDASHVCCDGHHSIVGTTDPTTYVCCGRGSYGYVRLARIGCHPLDESYPPLATRTYREG